MSDFDLLVFTADPDKARRVIHAGAAAVIVDWENKGKIERQSGADTEINHYGPDDLARVTRSRPPGGHVICRVNGMHANSRQEVACAVDNGADELLLPMVRRMDEVERLIEWTQGRCDASILVETLDALALAPRLASLPLRRIYVGLNDLAIDRRSRSLFDAVADGTLDALRPHVGAIPFGFGGLTLPECGSPIPCRLLRGELVRLGCSFTFLRRSFWRDMQGRQMEVEVPRILESVRGTATRLPSEVERDRQEFQDAVARLGQLP